MSSQQIIAYILLISCGTAVLMIPLIHYVWAGWSARRKDIMDGFGQDARLAYFRLFGRSDAVTKEEDAAGQFTAFHSRWYGRQFFLVPGLLAGSPPRGADFFLKRATNKSLGLKWNA
jgi:hypothetical protein